MNKKILLLVAVLASAALTAGAQNLVNNPGFETGDYTGWTVTGDTSFTGVTTTMPHSGSFSDQMGPSVSNGFLDQNIATTAGQSYIVDFWLANDDPTANNSFSAHFGGTTILSLTNSAPFSYTHFTSGPIMATSNSTDLNFTYFNPPAYWYLDDVSVSPVPEPGTLGLIAFGALGLVGAFRKRLV